MDQDKMKPGPRNGCEREEGGWQGDRRTTDIVEGREWSFWLGRVIHNWAGCEDRDQAGFC